MIAVFTLHVRVEDDSDVAEIIERAHRGRDIEQAWYEIADMLEGHELPDDALAVEDLEIIR